MHISSKWRAVAGPALLFLLVLAAILGVLGRFSKSMPDVDKSIEDPPSVGSSPEGGYSYVRRTTEYKDCRGEESTRPAGLSLTRRQVPADSCRATAIASTDSAITIYENGDRRFYRVTTEEPVRDEHIFRLVLQNELTAPSRLDSLEQALHREVDPILEPVGFDSIRIELEADRQKISRQLEQENIHLAVVPSSVVGNATGYYPSISDWAYQLFLTHGSYRSAVVFLRDTPIQELADLRDYTVAAPHEYSSSGYKIPLGYLAERGIQPRIRFLDGTHSDVWNAVLRGHVKAGFTYNEFKDELPPEKAGRLKTIEIPIRIPGSVWILREDLARLEGLEAVVRSVLKEFVENNEDPYWRTVSRPDAQVLAEYDTYRRLMNRMN